MAAPTTSVSQLDDAVRATVEVGLQETAAVVAVTATHEAGVYATSTAETGATATASTQFLATDVALTATSEAEVAAVATATAERVATATALAATVQLQMIRNWTPHRSQTQVVFSPDGDVLASGDLGATRIQLWDVRDGTLLKTIGPPEGDTNVGTGGVLTLAWHPNAALLASGSDNGRLTVWRVADGAQLTEAVVDGGYEVADVAWSPDGEVLVSGSAGSHISFWDSTDFSVGQQLDMNASALRSVVWSPDGQTLASASTISVKLWRVADGSLLSTMNNLFDEITDMAWSPDGKTLATSNRVGIQLLDAADGREIALLEQGSGNYSTVLSFSPNGTLLTDGATLWRASDGEIVRPLVHSTNASVSSVSWSPDGELLAVGFHDGSIWLWDVQR